MFHNMSTQITQQKALAQLFRLVYHAISSFSSARGKFLYLRDSFESACYV
jgi:hypothetical protein